MEKLCLVLRYIFFLPISLVAGIIISGLITLFYNLFCTLQFFSFYGICSSQRPFLAEALLVYVTVYLSYIIIPSKKILIAILELVLIGILYISIILFSLFYKGHFVQGWQDTLVIGLLSIGIAVYLFIDLQKKRHNICNAD